MTTYKNYDSADNIVPSYLESDFITALTKNTELMKASDTFKDYNYHGANMTMILELLSYLADFSSFHTNMVAKNVYMDSANTYETVHSLAQQKGYNPKGFISSWVTVTMEVSGDFDEGDQILIEPWQQINTGLDNSNGDTLYYSVTDEFVHTVETSGSTTTIQFPMRQGEIEIISRDYDDMIDNKLILPFHDYDYGAFPFTKKAVSVYVNDEEWERVDDFYDLLSGLLDTRALEQDDYYENLYFEKSLENDDVFMFKYDKYRRYAIEFNSSRNVPQKADDIVVYVLRSLGSQGVIRQNALTRDISDVNNLVIWNTTKDVQLESEQILTFYNEEPSVGGSDPEDIESIKISARSNVHSQYRNITSKDYRYHLEAHTNIIRGLAWGEQEVDPGNILEYNKTYISMIPPQGNPELDEDGKLLLDEVTGWPTKPYMFLSGTITTETSGWTWDDGNGTVLSAPIEIATGYTQDFQEDILQYLEPRKMLNNYEILVLPDIVYFRFDIGIRIKRIFSFRNVMEDVRDKLAYFFDRNNRYFNEEISFMDIHNFIMDTSITSNDNDFRYISGVDNLVLREINVFTTFNTGVEQTIFEPPSGASRGRFPQYKYDAHDTYYDNQLRPILLDYNQFPMLVVDMCRFFKEV